MTTTNLSICSDALPCGLGCDAAGCGFCRDVDPSVDVVEPDLEASTRRKVNHTSGNRGRDGLPALVMAHVALGAADTLGKGGLGEAEAVPDGLDCIHGLDTSAARI